MVRHCQAFTHADSGSRLHALYDCIAPLYFLATPFLRPIAARASSLVPARSSFTALDVATGTGILARALAQRGQRVTGVDLSVRMLAQRAKTRLRLGIAGAQMDARLLAFPDRAFDTVTISMALHEFPTDDRRRILAEMIRVSRRYVLVADFDGPQAFAIQLVERLERSHYRDFVVPGSLQLMLREAGLEIEREGRRFSVGLFLCRVPNR